MRLLGGTREKKRTTRENVSSSVARAELKSKRMNKKVSSGAGVAKKISEFKLFLNGDEAAKAFLLGFKG